MSLLTSLYSGVSGLETNSQDLTIIGDNIANANTIGFKQTRAAFADQLAQSVIGAGQIGLGSKLEMAQRILTQGSLTATGNALDLALQGNGMFVVHGSQDGTTSDFYTRDGRFSVDSQGYMVNLAGMRVQGYEADQTGAITSTLGDLSFGTATAQPQPSSTIKLKANLDASANVIAAPFDPANPTVTSNFATSTTIYDSLGTAHQASVYFRKTGAGTWEYHMLTDGAGVQGGTPGQPTEIGTGTMSFDAQGKLVDSTQSSSFNPNGATQPQALTMDFGTSTTAGGTGIDGLTQYASSSTVTFASQDGWASGELSGVQIANDGTINGSFTNGQTRPLGKVAVATFSAADRLSRVSDNLSAATTESGQASVGLAGTGGRGQIAAGALEQSNVDLATEFVRMISAQRGFQANGKTINTADQLLQELISLKR
ncbi:MAG: flagellar hook protein FlgE [Deltaproteobacteria bacterium]|nr:flagellar hook protein FlgE [Deltaproteobacteria bacterium]